MGSSSVQEDEEEEEEKKRKKKERERRRKKEEVFLAFPTDTNRNWRFREQAYSNEDHFQRKQGDREGGGWGGERSWGGGGERELTENSHLLAHENGHYYNNIRSKNAASRDGNWTRLAAVPTLGNLCGLKSRSLVEQFHSSTAKFYDSNAGKFDKEAI